MFYRKQALKCLRNINSVSSSTVPCKHCNKQYYCIHMIKLNVIKLTFIFMCFHIKIVFAVGESNEDAFWFLLPIMCRDRHKVIISHISAVAADIKVHLRGVNCLGSTREKWDRKIKECHIFRFCFSWSAAFDTRTFHKVWSLHQTSSVQSGYCSSNRGHSQSYDKQRWRLLEKEL